MNANPMNNIKHALAAPRCQATSKRTGVRCKGPAIRGWRVCRFHGAGGGAPYGIRNGNYRHGARTYETMELIQEANELARFARANLNSGLLR